ncbi:putative exocyst complex component Exo70, cullin repeat-like-containing domain superfamily [Helianthus debilis subsp. tardiflorus]
MEKAQSRSTPNVLLDFEMLFTDESGELYCNEVKAVSSGLGEATMGTFVEFENAVKGENSRRALRGGLLSLITSLEANLEEKSRLYDDNALQYVFLMNNILYIVQKVKDFELRNLLGDRWIRTHRGQIRQWHTSYLRSAWGESIDVFEG